MLDHQLENDSQADFEEQERRYEEGFESYKLELLKEANYFIFGHIGFVSDELAKCIAFAALEEEVYGMKLANDIGLEKEHLYAIEGEEDLLQILYDKYL